MDTLVSIGEAAKRCGVHEETLKRWEKSGDVTPRFTKGGHRRYDLLELEAILTIKKITVVLLHREREKVACVQLPTMPQKGELIWLNRRCYEVEKIVYSYIQNESGTDAPDWFPPHIYLVDISEEEAKKYDVVNVEDWDRNDWIGHLGGK